MPEPSESFSWRGVAISGYGPNLLYGVAEGAFLAVAVLAARELGASVAVAGSVVVVFGLGSWLSNVPAGRLVHSVGEGRSLFLAGILGVVAAALGGLGGHVAPYLVGALLLGVASSVVKLARQSFLASVVPVHRRGLAMSVLGGVYRVGVFIGPLVGSVVISRYGLFASFAVVAVGMAGSGLLGLLVRSTPASAGGHAPTRAVDVVREHRRVLATVGIGVLGVSLLRAIRAVALPLWAEQLGIGPAAVAVVFAISAFVDVLLFVPAGLALDRLGRRLVTVPAMTLMSLSLVVLPLTGDRTTLTLVAVVVGLGNGLTSGIIQTLGADYAPPQARAPFLGVWRLIADTGTVGGPALVSGLTAAVGLAPALVAVGVVGLATTVVMQRSLPPGRTTT